MKYYKYENEYEEMGDGWTYIEVKDDYSQRQITTDGINYLSSNIYDENEGLILADQPCDNDSIEAVIKITKEEFDAVWQKRLLSHQHIWNQVKGKNKKNDLIAGHIFRIFPQGVIVIIDKNTFGVVNYEECEKSVNDSHYLSFGHPIVAIVSGYDEENHWLTLTAPKILPDSLDYHELMSVINLENE